MSAQATTATLNQEEIASLTQNLFGLWKSGGTFAQAKNISDAECEAMYTYGHSLYLQAKYNDAFKIFAQLVAYNHMESRYQMALASAMQMTKRYEEALTHYMIVTVMRLDDPAPVYHCAECLLALGRPVEAADSLTLVDTLCEPGKHDAIKTRAATLLQALNDKLS